MRCQDYRKYLNPYIDSELDARTSADIAEHLSVCEACNKYFALEQEVERRLAKRWQREKMPEEFWMTMLQRLSAYETTSWRRIRLAWFIPAAVVPVAATVLVWVFLWGGISDNVGPLAEDFQEMHGKYLRHEIPIGPGLSWPQGFEGLTVIKNLPQSDVINGHELKLIGSRPFYIKGVAGVHVIYTCCKIPISMFVFRKEDMGSFTRAQRLLDKGKGSAVINLGNMRLAMKDLKEVVVCCVSSHDTRELFTAFERL